MDKIYTCGKCRVGYRVQEPRANAERLGCPDCGLFFWSGRNDNSPRTKVGITPQEYERIGGDIDRLFKD